MKTEISAAVQVFEKAFDSLMMSDRIEEIEWQRNRQAMAISEDEFLAEAAWVVLNSGFREATVRSKFDYISLCFLDWSSAKEIVDAKEQCIASALVAFRHIGKMSAIAKVAEIIEAKGFSDFRDAVLADPINELRKLPQIGPITVWHLAKNLGFDVAKPDRHLVRFAREYGFENVHSFCEAIAAQTGEKVAVVDLVLWRYLATRLVRTNSIVAEEAHNFV